MTQAQRLWIVAYASRLTTGVASLRALAAKIIVLTVRDPDTGQRVFERGDERSLAELPIDVLNELVEPAVRISSLVLDMRAG